MSLLIIRLVVFILLFWVGFRLWQYWQTIANKNQSNPNQANHNLSNQNQAKNSQTNQNQNNSEAMVCCAKCKVHLPKSSALQAGEHYFCSHEHQDSFDKPDSSTKE